MARVFSYKFRLIQCPPNTIASSTDKAFATKLEFPTPSKKEPTMINAKRIARLAKKWQRVAALGRKRLTMTMTTADEGCSTAVAGKGHCVMYTTNGRRFEVPLAYLSTVVFSELLRMSQEVFCFAGTEGRIELPCDTVVMEYAMSLLRRSASVEMEAAFVSSMVMPTYYAVPPVGVSQHVIVCSC